MMPTELTDTVRVIQNRLEPFPIRSLIVCSTYQVLDAESSGGRVELLTEVHKVAEAPETEETEYDRSTTRAVCNTTYHLSL